MAQTGTLFKKKSKDGTAAWILKYNEMGEDGRWRARMKRICAVDSQFPRERDVRNAGLLAPYLDPVNVIQQAKESTASGTISPTIRLTDYIETVFFPAKTKELKPSTMNGYQHIYDKHVRERLGDTRVVHCSIGFCQRLLRDVATHRTEDGAPLAGITLHHIRSFLTSVFNFACQDDLLRENPVKQCTTPKGDSNHKPDDYAYDLNEVTAILAALDGIEPARTVIATAAFSGLTKSELRGLRWEDFKDGVLTVKRGVWASSIQTPKTQARVADVPVISQLADILAAHRNGYPASGFIFAGPKLNKPLDLHNLVARSIKPALAKAKVPWHGLHAFRRGLASNLFELLAKGDETKVQTVLPVIQSIMRHSDAATTLKHYLKVRRPVKAEAMEKLSKMLAAMASRKSSLGIRRSISVKR
jgi:integrase